MKRLEYTLPARSRTMMCLFKNYEIEKSLRNLGSHFFVFVPSCRMVAISMCDLSRTESLSV